MPEDLGSKPDQPEVNKKAALESDRLARIQQVGPKFLEHLRKTQLAPALAMFRARLDQQAIGGVRKNLEQEAAETPGKPVEPPRIEGLSTRAQSSSETAKRLWTDLSLGQIKDENENDDEP